MNRHSFQPAQPHPLGKSKGGFAAQPCAVEQKVQLLLNRSSSGTGEFQVLCKEFWAALLNKELKVRSQRERERKKKENLIFALDFAKGKF